MKKLIILCLLFMVGCTTIKQTKSVIVPTGASSANTEPEHFLKKRIAIARFSNETRQSNSLFLSDAEIQAKLARQATDILLAKLAATNKFLLSEREESSSFANEAELQNIDNSTIPADYLIVGSITEFSRKITGETGAFSRTKKQTAYAKVHLRLVNVRTKQIIYGEESEGEAFSEVGTVFGVGSKAGYDDTINDKAIDAAISKTVSNLISELDQEPWRSYILDIQDNSIIISGGQQQGITKADVFLIMQKGKTVKNPQTGVNIELPGTEIGKVRVVSSQGQDINELSICELISGSMPTPELNQYYIVKEGE